MPFALYVHKRKKPDNKREERLTRSDRTVSGEGGMGEEREEFQHMLSIIAPRSQKYEHFNFCNHGEVERVSDLLLEEGR